tara:strand:- start:1707 stop:2081 length:375 start_codon:yes stop_codon:yes gene_type:complete
MSGYRILVCGGRDYQNEIRVAQVLNSAYESNVTFGEYDTIIIIQGEAKGADALAKEWAGSNSLQHLKFPAKWDEHGKKAGYLRNKQMLDEGKPDVVIAFPGGKGTALMIRLAEEAKVPVVDLRD